VGARPESDELARAIRVAGRIDARGLGYADVAGCIDARGLGYADVGARSCVATSRRGLQRLDSGRGTRCAMAARAQRNGEDQCQE
jgi:hypothetical protein